MIHELAAEIAALDATLRARIVEWLTRPAVAETAEGTPAVAPTTSSQPAGP